MTAYAGVVRASLFALLKGWRLFPFILFLRAALGLAGVFPVVLIIAILVRLVMTAPADPVSGWPDLAAAFHAFFTHPKAVAAAAGALAAVFSLQFILLSLTDAGIYGAFAASFRNRELLSLNGFSRHALRLFGRMALLRLVMTALALAGMSLLFTAAMIVLKTSIPVAALKNGAEIPLLQIGLLAGLAVIGLTAIILLWLFATACTAALASHPSTVSAALSEGGRFFHRRAPAILVLYAFFGSLSLIWAGAQLSGEIWWLRLGEGMESTAWPHLAAAAWNLTFAFLGVGLWVLTQISQVKLFLDSDQRTSGYYS